MKDLIDRFETILGELDHAIQEGVILSEDEANKLHDFAYKASAMVDELVDRSLGFTPSKKLVRDSEPLAKSNRFVRCEKHRDIHLERVTCERPRFVGTGYGRYNDSRDLEDSHSDADPGL